MERVSFVETVNGLQVLNVRGKRLEGMAYITYLTEKNCYRSFAEAGVRLFSLPVFFGYRMVNEKHQLPVFTPGIFDGAAPNFTYFDRDMASLLEACPDAMVFPRVNISVPERWEREHPEELNDFGPPQHPECRRPCFASDAWIEEIRRELSVFLDHVSSMPYAENIVGYQIAGGNTEEWFPYNCAGGFGKRFDEKFLQHYPGETPDPENEAYLRFSSQITAQRICDLARIFKELTDHRFVIGSFYGYTLELGCPLQGHHDLAQVLSCKDLDFICSPISYTNTRRAGVDHPLMVPISSVKLHGKLYFTENDSRTHLSRPIADIPNYVKPIWFGPETEAATIELLKMHFAKSIVGGHAHWWFDMWGGWYETKGYMAFMKQAFEVYGDAMKHSLESAAEVAVFVDEACFVKQKDPALRDACVSKARQILATAGAPFDVFLASDLPLLSLARYRAAVLLVPAETEGSRAVRDAFASQGIPTLSVTPESAAELPAALEALYEAGGVHRYCRDGAVLYANASYLFLHGTADGEICLATDKALFEVFEETEYPHRFHLKKGESKLFCWKEKGE